ncbi:MULTISPECIES: GGDEF domain-containing protein [unclassified Rhodococcus (in: high G+C Gram-positive bacteria)]|uniref:diguanylate cyclase domain-containing protein n=1 Tax=unclassified Rhodococcus (in: high G+C Gram-positive bacteria) TaxID=192944 RepID=UPI0014483CB1|nr:MULTISPECIES: GGDEF domain-containing protein [unclassified Rhodococcus (in: high G+C Gram-positive bacteria)]
MAVVPLVQEKSIGWVGLIESYDRTWSEESLHLAAESDALTGLANRRRFTDDLLRRLSSGAGPVVLLFLDLDRLKARNDFYGHSAGDESTS